MKNLRKIKWENIYSIVMIVFGIAATVAHIRLNGFYGELFLEWLIDEIFLFGGRYIVKDWRTNPTNWD